METNWKTATWLVVFCVVWVLAGRAQDVNSQPMRGDLITIEGELTYVQTKGPAILELKTAEGKEYRVQLPLGMIAELRSEGFDLKIGKKIGSIGEVVCVLAGKPVITGSKIMSNGKTYRIAPGPS